MVIMSPAFILVIGTTLLQAILAERNQNVDILYEGSDVPYSNSNVDLNYGKDGYFNDLNDDDGYYPEVEDYDYEEEEEIFFDDDDGYFEAYYNMSDHSDGRYATLRGGKSLYEIARTFKGKKGGFGYRIMAELIELAGLKELLSDCSNNAPKYTLFTFQLHAAKRFGKRNLEKLKEEKHRDKLKKLMLHHIVPKEIKHMDLKNGKLNGKLNTLGGGTIHVKKRRLKNVIKSSAYKPEGYSAWVNMEDNQGCNGMFMGINAILTPNGLRLP